MGARSLVGNAFSFGCHSKSDVTDSQNIAPVKLFFARKENLSRSNLSAQASTNKPSKRDETAQTRRRRRPTHAHFRGSGGRTERGARRREGPLTENYEVGPQLDAHAPQAALHVARGGSGQVGKGGEICDAPQRERETPKKVVLHFSQKLRGDAIFPRDSDAVGPSRRRRRRSSPPRWPSINLKSQTSKWGLEKNHFPFVTNQLAWEEGEKVKRA